MMNFIYVSIDSLNRRHLFQTSFMMFTPTHLHTVNQLLLFATTLFWESSEINWFAATNLRDQALSTPIFSLQHYYKYWSASRNICNNEAPANFAKISCMWIKVGLQYVIIANMYREHDYLHFLIKAFLCPTIPLQNKNLIIFEENLKLNRKVVSMFDNVRVQYSFW